MDLIGLQSRGMAFFVAPADDVGNKTWSFGVWKGVQQDHMSQAQAYKAYRPQAHWWLASLVVHGFLLVTLGPGAMLPAPDREAEWRIVGRVQALPSTPGTMVRFRERSFAHASPAPRASSPHAAPTLTARSSVPPPSRPSVPSGVSKPPAVQGIALHTARVDAPAPVIPLVINRTQPSHVAVDPLPAPHPSPSPTLALNPAGAVASASTSSGSVSPPAPSSGEVPSGSEPSPLPTQAREAAPPISRVRAASQVPQALAEASQGVSTAVSSSIDPRADFSVVYTYQNDTRIPRDSKGLPVIDVAVLSGLPQVKPVLAGTGRGLIPLRDAAAYGLRPGASIRARVVVSIEAAQDLPVLVSPTKVRILEASQDGQELLPATRDRVLCFLQDQVVATQWMPALDKGTVVARSEQAFEVWIVQVREDRVAQAPGH